MNRLELINIHKNYEGKPLLKGINLNVASGETLCLLGTFWQRQEHLATHYRGDWNPRIAAMCGGTERASATCRPGSGSLA